LALIVLGASALAANVSVSPGSGPGNKLASVSSSGFLPDAVTGTIFANTGFYIDDGFMVGCPNPDGSAWANCTVMIRMPTVVGPHVIRAANSFGESATTTYTVVPPKLSASPAFGPPGTHVSVRGSSFAADANLGLYIDSGLYQNVVTDESGNFTTSLTLPDLTPGLHDIVGVSGGGNASAPITVTNCIGSVVPGPGGGTLTPAGGGPPIHLNPGSPVPIQKGDSVNNGPGDPLNINLIDGTQFTMAPNTGVTMNDYVYDPGDNSHDKGVYGVFAGAFQYVSGLITKTPDPNVQIITEFSYTGIRGTEFLARLAPCSSTQEVYLIEGRLAITPKATPGVTNLYDAPISLFITSNNVTTNVLSQAMYDSLVSEMLPLNTTVTLGSWLVQYFGCTNNNAAAAPAADPDGDGQDNLTEFLAGTDPTKNSSAFRLLSATPDGNDMRICWMCGGGRTNVVQASASLTGGWMDVSPHLTLPDVGDVTTNYLDSGAITNASARYYRVQLVQ